MDAPIEVELQKSLDNLHIPRYHELPDFGLRL